MSDRQQKRVYAFEDMWAESSVNTLTLQEARNYIANACALYGFRPPVVRQHHTEEISYSWSGAKPHISLRARNHKNPFVALHEAAHMITDQIFESDEFEHHGSEWLGIYFVLLEISKTAPREAIYACARRHRLDWMPFCQINPKALGSGPRKWRVRQARTVN